MSINKQNDLYNIFDQIKELPEEVKAKLLLAVNLTEYDFEKVTEIEWFDSDNRLNFADDDEVEAHVEDYATIIREPSDLTDELMKGSWDELTESEKETFREFIKGDDDGSK